MITITTQQTTASANKQGEFAIHVAVTGHCKIAGDCEIKLQTAVDKELKELQKYYPASPIKLLTGLAIGADTLVANVALKLGIKLIAVLPMAVEEYKNDFNHTDDLAELNRLLSVCEEIIVTSNIKKADALADLNGLQSAREETIVTSGEARKKCYAAQGAFLVNHSQVLLALWDGRPAEGTGGTGHVVAMARGGETGNEDDCLLAADPLPYVIHIMTPRPQKEASTSLVIAGADAGAIIPDLTGLSTSKVRNQQILKKFEELNQESVNHKNLAASLDISKDYLLGKDKYTIVQKNIFFEKMVSAYSFTDTLAQARQKKRREYILITTALALLSILFIQTYSGPIKEPIVLILHITFAGLAFYFYNHFFKSKKQYEMQFLEWRVLAESLRVQIFWSLANINKSVTSAYNTTQTKEAEWMIHLINNLNIYKLKLIQTNSEYQIVHDRWILDQSKYFKGASDKKARQAGFFKNLTLILFLLAVTLTILILMGHLNKVSEHVLDWAVLASGMAFVFSGALSTYSEQMCFDENAKSYANMDALFSRALGKLNKLKESADASLESRVTSIFTQCGIQAIQENLTWYQIHRLNEFKPDPA